MGMQEHALQTCCLEGLVGIPIPVLIVPRHRMPDIGGMHPNLVSAAGIDADIDQGRAAETLQGYEQALGLLALPANLHDALASLHLVLLQGCIHLPGDTLPSMGQQSQVMLLHGTVPESSMQRPHCTAAF